MQILRKVVTAIGTAMPVIYCEVWCLHSIFSDIQYNAHPVFIVLPGYALVGIDCVGFNIAILFVADFGWVEGVSVAWTYTVLGYLGQLFDNLFFGFEVDMGFELYSLS